MSYYAAPAPPGHWTPQVPQQQVPQQQPPAYGGHPQGAYPGHHGGAPAQHFSSAPPAQYGAPQPPQPPYGAAPPQYYANQYNQAPPHGQYQQPPPYGYAPPPPGAYGQAPPVGYPGGHHQPVAAPGMHQSYGANPQAIGGMGVTGMPQTGQFGLPVTPGNHVAQFSQTFKVEETVASATQDSFVVKDMHGRTVYKVNGSFTVNERKTMVDMHGKTLLKIKEARMATREKLTISSAQGVPILVVQQNGMAQLGSKTAKAYLGGSASGSPVFSINGNRNATHFRLTDNGGREIAVIARKANSIKHKLTGQDSYETTVMPGVDQALMAMVTVCIDEIWCD